MKAIIIGANGYLGKNLAFHLLKSNWQIQLLDLQDVSEIAADFYQKCDVSNRNELNKIDFNVDYIFHFAGRTGTGISFNNYTEFIQANEIGLLNVLDEIKTMTNPPRVIFPSTRLVYRGIENTPLSEETPKEFKTPYAITKYACEQYLTMYSRLYGLKHTIFRICVPYGNLVDSSYSYGTIGFFLNKAMKKEAITLYGDGELRRTFTHVSDLIDQMLACIAKPESINDVFNIGGETYSLKEIAMYIAQLYGVQVSNIDWPAIDLKIESGDTIFDASKLKNLTGDLEKNQLKSWVRSLKI